MSLVGRVGRKRPRARIALAILYVALVLGAVTTVYPFLLMATTGFKGPTDQNDNKIVPAYFQDLDSRDEGGKLNEASLLGKYLADKYAGDAGQIASTRTGSEATADSIETYERFLKELPVDYWSAGFKTASGQVTSRLARRYRQWLREKYGTIENMNRTYIEENVAFQTVSPPAELLERANWKQPATRKYREWREFKATLPIEFRLPVRETRLYQEFVRAKFQNQFEQVPPELAGTAKKFEALHIQTGTATHKEFLQAGLPSRYRKGAAERLFNDYSADPIEVPLPNVGRKEKTIEIPTIPPKEKVLAVPDLSLEPEIERDPSVDMPIQAYEEAFVRTTAAEMRREFAGRNYAFVMDYVALNGRALWNTAIFCLLAVITQLTVNPLAAYALSRYPISASGKILIFLLATMAFPAEVAMIPSFLLLKDLGLLNTFAALVLPTMASGYMIFLLKGFFDSLPQELFEAGQIDGAKESTMMTKIALPLSKPVLGYLALIAFMAAYGAFLYAFLVVQDQKMWTLMVWIYQLQQTAPRAVVMAALTIAAIPTFVVFMLAQRTIMRGIVLPSER